MCCIINNTNENLSFEKEWPAAWPDTDKILFSKLRPVIIDIMTFSHFSFMKLQFYKEESYFLLMKLFEDQMEKLF